MYLKTIILLAIILCQVSCRMPVRWVSDGKGKIFAVNEKTIHVIENDKPVLISEIENGVTTVCTCAEWNMDKNLLAVATTSSAGVKDRMWYVSIFAIDPLTKKEAVLIEEVGNCIADMKWLSNGSEIAYTRVDDSDGHGPEIQLRTVDGGGKSRLLLDNSTVFSACMTIVEMNVLLPAGHSVIRRTLRYCKWEK